MHHCFVQLVVTSMQQVFGVRVALYSRNTIKYSKLMHFMLKSLIVLFFYSHLTPMSHRL